MKNTEARNNQEIPKDQPARPPEKPELAHEQVPVAETRETMGPDGKKIELVCIGGELVAQKGADKVVRVGELSETSAQVGKEVGVTFEDLEDNFKSYIDSVIGTSDLAGEDADNMRMEMKGGMFGFLSGAALAENPPEALTAELRKAAEGTVDIPREPSLAELQADIAELRSTISSLEQKHESTRGNTASVAEAKKKIESEIEKAIRELKAAERGVLALKEAAHPKASKKEQSVMAAETMGMVPAHEAWAAVKDLPEVSRKTLEAYKKRMQEIPRLIAEIQAEKPAVTVIDRRSGRAQELTPAEKKVQTLQTELAQLGQESLLIETGLQLHEQSKQFNQVFDEADKATKEQIEKAVAEQQKKQEKKGKEVQFWQSHLDSLNAGLDVITKQFNEIPNEQAVLDQEFRNAEQKLAAAEQKKAKNDADPKFQAFLEMINDKDATIDEIAAAGAEIESIKAKQKALVEKQKRLDDRLTKRAKSLNHFRGVLQDTMNELQAMSNASIDFPTNATVDPKDSSAFKNLADLHAANPEATEAYIQSALADKTIARGERAVLETFQNRTQETIPSFVAEVTPKIDVSPAVPEQQSSETTGESINELSAQLAEAKAQLKAERLEIRQQVAKEMGVDQRLVNVSMRDRFSLSPEDYQAEEAFNERAVKAYFADKKIRDLENRIDSLNDRIDTAKELETPNEPPPAPEDVPVRTFNAAPVDKDARVAQIMESNAEQGKPFSFLEAQSQAEREMGTLERPVMREPVKINNAESATQTPESIFTNTETEPVGAYDDLMTQNKEFAQQIDAIASEASIINLAKEIGNPAYSPETIAFNKAIFDALSVETKASSKLPATWEEVVNPKIGFLGRLTGGKNRARITLLDKINDLQGKFTSTGQEGALLMRYAADAARSRTEKSYQEKGPKGLV